MKAHKAIADGAHLERVEQLVESLSLMDGNESATAFCAMITLAETSAITSYVLHFDIVGFRIRSRRVLVPINACMPVF